MLNQRLADACAQYGDRPALISQDGQSVSFARLATHVTRLHLRLAQAGIEPGDQVVLDIDNPTVAILLRLALLRRGADIVQSAGAEMALNAGLPLDFEITYAGGSATRSPLRRVAFTQEWLSVDVGPEPDWQPAGQIVLNTSGSTGTPRFMRISAESLARREDRVNTLAGPLEGGILNLIPTATARGARYLNRALFGGHPMMGPQGPVRTTLVWAKEFGLTELVASPVSLADIISTIEAGGPKPRFTRIHMGGAGVSRDLLMRAEDMFGAEILVSVGATETGTFAHAGFDRARFAIGWAGAIVDWVETQLHEKGHFPHHAPNAGRLSVRVPKADRVTGYLGQAGAVYDAHGWFHTGDIAVLNEAREIRLLGRADFVINLSGDKIAPEAIETALSEKFHLTAVAATKAPALKAEEEALGIVLVGTEGAQAEIRGFLQAELRAVNAVRIIRVVGLPMLPGGKLNRRALPGLFTADHARSAPQG